MAKTTAEITNTYLPVIADVIDGWNEKLELTNDQLALFVPFCDLYAALSEDGGSTDQATKRMIDSGFSVRLKGWAESISKTLIPIFNLYEQQTTIDPSTGRLLRSKGVGGIESLDFETSNVDNEMFSARLKVSVPSFDEDVLTNKALRMLTIPGSEFVLAYGWARDSSKGNRDFAPISNSIIDLTAANKGYYRFIHCALLSCQWEYTAARIAEGDLYFRPLSHVAAKAATMSVHKKNIKSLLTDESKLRATCAQNVPAINDQLKNVAVSFKKKRPLQKTIGKGKKTVNQEDAGYYSLGWVIEAMRQSMDDGFWSHTNYEKFIDPRNTKVKTLGDTDGESASFVAHSPAGIPISINDLDSQVFDLSTNETILFSIGKVLELANEQLFVNTALMVQGESDGSTFSIRDMHDVVFNVANRTDALSINVASPNSLLENIRFGSRIPLDWTYGLNILVNTNEGATEIYNIFAKDAALDHPKTTTGALLKKFKKASMGNGEALDSNRLSNWKQTLNASDKKDKIVSEVLSSTTVPIGLALRQFFQSITVTIHGTALVPPWTQIALRGMLPGVDGIYSVFRTSDSLSPGNFSTSIEALLIKIFP